MHAAGCPVSQKKNAKKRKYEKTEPETTTGLSDRLLKSAPAAPRDGPLATAQGNAEAASGSTEVPRAQGQEAFASDGLTADQRARIVQNRAKAMAKKTSKAKGKAKGKAQAKARSASSHSPADEEVLP